MNKLVVRLGGGLGNQLHEYALARYMADLTGREIVFDLTNFALWKNCPCYRPFQLNHFIGSAKCRRWGWLREWAFFVLWIINRKVSERMFVGLIRLLRITWVDVKEPFRYQPGLTSPGILNYPGTIYLSGCYGHVPQMPDRGNLRQVFEVNTPLSEENRRYFAEMSSSNSVSLHVRRSDYLWACNGAPALSAVYQRRAVEEMRKRIAAPRWFVFSDDIEWCRKEFADLENAVFVRGNEEQPWEDLRLMAACRHHVIANSTFSWWGAYLGSDDGVTLCPDPWFGKGLHMPPSGVASTWISVSSLP